MKRLLLSVFILLAGCAIPHTYDDPVNPNLVTDAALASRAVELEEHYQEVSQMEGIVFRSHRTDVSMSLPNKFGNGGDSCIFTGHKLAADVYNYGVTGAKEDLSKVVQSLRGLYLLTHITGKPGVICRTAFPLRIANRWNYPENWEERVAEGFVHESTDTVEDPFRHGKPFDAMVYYTRATKDQLTGLLFGLTVTWKHLRASTEEHIPLVDAIRYVVATIVEDVYSHLREHSFKIRDEKGENDTNADGVDGLMLTQLLALYRHTAVTTNPKKVKKIKERYRKGFTLSFKGPHSWFNRFNNYQQYYAWNLRYLRSYSVFQLENDPGRQVDIMVYMRRRLWPFTRNHLNTKFIYLYNAVSGDEDNLDDALFALKSLSLKPIRGEDSPLGGDERSPSLLQVLLGDWDKFVLAPHLRKKTGFSIWQKTPWGVGNVGYKGKEDATGIDYLLAYWMGRYYGYLR